MSKKTNPPSSANVSGPVFGAHGNGAQQRVSIEQAIEIAGRHIEAGQLQQAHGILDQILKQMPGHAYALHLLGLIEFQGGHPENAVRTIEKAIQGMPSEPLFYRNLGEIHRQIKSLEKSVECSKKAVALAPKDAVAHSNLGIAYFDLGQLDEAEACQKRALELQPTLAQALNNTGSICRERRDKEAALEYFRKVLELAPDYLEARNNLAAVLTEMDEPEEAMQELTIVLRQRPNYADAHCNMGNVFLCLEQYDKARMAFTQSLRLNPQLRTASNGMVRLDLQEDLHEAALENARRVVDMAPERSDSHILMGDVWMAMEEFDQAEAAYRKAQELEPDSPRAKVGLGQMWLELGKLDQAVEALNDAIRLDSSELYAHLHMAHARTVKQGDPVIQHLEEEYQKADSMPPSKLMSLSFAMGKLYDDLKQYDKAFPHFAEGCRLKRKRFQYDANTQDLVCDNLRKFFTAQNIEALRGGGDPSNMPIFVLGMPRSGTTLMETIIASHPDVVGAGELKELLRVASVNRSGASGQGFPNNMTGITRDELTAMGAQYVSSVRTRAPDSPRITDKMPANFMALGLIHLILPNARIIHIKRNPVDTCLSNFTKMFNSGQYHSYDLRELGRYYVAYARLMEHWREVLPEGAFLDVQYEELVGDREAQTRRIIDYLGLEWNDACLEHHKTERHVRTASITQVRQPVYKTSVERWRNYEAHLQPLLEALGDYAP